MGLTLGITGMDRATEAQFRAAFEQASPALQGKWRLTSEAEADYVAVDMDSMYGPMSWIRLHAAGKQVIALTTSERTQADHLLSQPFDAGSLGALLRGIGGPGDAPAPSVAKPLPAAPQFSPAPAPAHQLPEERPLPADEEAAPPPEPAAAIEPVSAPPAAPAGERTLADWLVPGALTGRWRFERDGIAFVFDADARSYHGSATLKPLAPAFAQPVPRGQLAALDEAAWTAAIGRLGAAQPLSRLQWLGGLLAGNGALLPGHDPAGRYRLLKWPQTEREYPKHFRLATAMMKGATTVAELAGASGVSTAEAADFVNANLATGYAEPVQDLPPEPAEPPKSGGLFGRIRGR